MHDLSVIITLAGALAVALAMGGAHRAPRPLDARASIVATAESEAERAWLQEFGVAYVADVFDEMSESLARAVRRLL